MNVLYIDDDAINRAVLHEMFQLGQVDLVQAEDVKSGFALLEQADFDIILMDLRMPEVNGLTAIRQVRARKDAKATLPIVVVTADLSQGVRELCRQAGANGFLPKPVGMDQLFDTVGTVMVESRRVLLH